MTFVFWAMGLLVCCVFVCFVLFFVCLFCWWPFFSVKLMKYSASRPENPSVFYYIQQIWRYMVPHILQKLTNVRDCTFTVILSFPPYSLPNGLNMTTIALSQSIQIGGKKKSIKIRWRQKIFALNSLARNEPLSYLYRKPGKIGFVFVT